jgi:two-component system response regulator GlrR
MAQREFEHKYLIDVLKATRGNVTKAANVAKRNRTEFHRLLKKHKIEAKAFRQE